MDSFLPFMRVKRYCLICWTRDALYVPMEHWWQRLFHAFAHIGIEGE